MLDIKQTVTGDEPISIDEVKLYSKIDYTAEDDLIESLITGVRQQVEHFTGLSLIEKEIEAFWDYLPEKVCLPFPEHNEIVEVKINGEVSTDYEKVGLSRFVLYPKSITVTGLVNKSFYVKYTTLGTCGEIVKTEMLRLIDEKYRNRGNTFVGTTQILPENTFANLAQYVVDF